MPEPSQTQTDKSVAEIEELNRAVFETEALGICEVAPDGRILRGNRKFCSMLAYSDSELKKMKFQDFTHPEDLDKDMELFGSLLRGEIKTYRLEKRYIRKNKATIWVLLNVSMVSSRDGRSLYGIATIFDITERKKVEAEQREIERRLHLALQGADAGVWGLDIATGKTYWSKEFLPLYGYDTSASLTYESWIGSIHPVDRKRVEADFRDRLESSQTEFRQEFRIIHPQRGVRWILDMGRIERDANGKALRCDGINIDITERKQSEQALRESEERYALVLAGSEAAIWDWDVQRKKVLFSPRWKELRGMSEEEMGDDEEEWRHRIHPEDFDRVMNAVKDHFDGKTQVFCAEYRVRHKDGRWLWILDRGIARRDASGKVVRMAGSETDITQRKQIEVDLKNANQKLQESHLQLENQVRERTKLAELRAEKLRELASALTLAEQRERNRLAQILHDHLQQLLVAIKIGMSRVKLECTGRNLRQTVEQMEGLTDEAITASRTFTVELSPPILRDAGIFSAIEWLARWFQEKHGLQVEVSSAPGLKIPSEDVKIFLFQSVRELLLNIVKHAKTSRAWVNLTSGDNNICVEVVDRGRGFDPEAMYQKTSEGFGLFHVFERLELLGGKVTVESTPGKGARFFLSAPAYAEEIKPRELQQKERIKRDVVLIDEGNGGQVRVLVADDHKILRQGLINMLNAKGDIKVVGEAADGEEVVQLAEVLMPDVIVMDISMPKMNGIEATEEIKSRFPGIQVIGLSLHESEDMSETMRRAGASAYLTKSGPLDGLVKTIKKVVAHHALKGT